MSSHPLQLTIMIRLFASEEEEEEEELKMEKERRKRENFDACHLRVREKNGVKE